MMKIKMPFQQHRIASYCLALALVWVAAAELSHGAENGNRLAESQLSPQGNIIVEHWSNAETSEWELWLRAKDGKQRALLYAYRRHVEVLFSPDQKHILITDECGSSEARVVLFTHKNGLNYRREPDALNNILWKYFSKANGYKGKNHPYPDENNVMVDNYAPYDHNYLRGLQWITDEIFVVSIEGHIGGGEYSDPWLCFYDIKTKTPFLDLSMLNKGKVHHRPLGKVLKEKFSVFSNLWTSFKKKYQSK